MVEDTEGNTFYVDFERIKKLDGYVYFWRLSVTRHFGSNNILI
jgi:hypothetical protein